MKYLKGTRLILSAVILAVLMCSFSGCIKIIKVSLTADKFEAAVGEPVQFFNESKGKFESWSWDFGDGGTSTELNPSYTYKEPGNYFVTLVLFTEDDQYFDTLEINVSGSPSDMPQTDAPAKDKQVTIELSGITISRIEMCTGPIERDECKLQPGATYRTGNTISVWFEITGFNVQESDDNYEAWVQWRRYSLYAPDGGLITTDSNLLEWHEFPPSADHIEAFHGWRNIGLVEAIDPRGKYRVEIEIEDMLSGEVVVETIVFTITESATGKTLPPVTQDELVITLERTACFGKCPVYSLMIKGDGTVIYSGVDFVQTRGIQETTISIDAINQLVAEFEKANYFSLKDSYTAFGISDMPSANTSISIGGRTKAINHYLGDRSAPKQLTELENKIDEIVNSAQWIK